MTAKLDQLREAITNGAKLNAANFKEPDDDFMPVLMYLNGAGKPAILGIDNTADPGQEEKVKTMASRVIETTLRMAHAQAAAFLMSVWLAHAPAGTSIDDARRGKLRASQMPDRQEVLWLQLTDGEEYEVWQAPLIRHAGAPPTIGDWKKSEGDAKSSEGRFALWPMFRRAVGES